MLSIRNHFVIVKCLKNWDCDFELVIKRLINDGESPEDILKLVCKYLDGIWKKRAYDALSLLNSPEAVRILTRRAMHNADWALESLAQNPNESVKDGLLECLGAEAKQIREGALEIIKQRKIGNPDLINAYWKVLKNYRLYSETRIDAILALYSLGVNDLQFVRTLISNLGDWASKVRCTAAKVLGELGNPLAIKPLKAVQEWGYYFENVRPKQIEIFFNNSCKSAAKNALQRLSDGTTTRNPK